MARTNAFPIEKLALADTVTTLPYQDLHIYIHFLRKETTGDRIWFLCTAGFYYKFVKLQGRSGETPIHIYLQPRPLSSEKWRKKKTTNKNTGKKNTSEHLKEGFGTFFFNHIRRQQV